MDSNPNIQTMAADPAAFRAGLLIETEAGPRPLADLCDLWQQQDFAALDPAWRRVAGQSVSVVHQRAWLERPRGHSKTFDLAVMAAWVLLTPHRRLSGVAAAADQDQARLLRDALSRLVALNPWMGKLLDVQRNVVRNPHTDSQLAILSSDPPTSYGLTPDFIIADELTHWGQRRELWDSLLSASAKRSHCLLLVIGNAGFQDSWQWTTREAVRNDPDWHFHALEETVASWISEKALAEQRRLLPPLAFDRLWLNRWSAGSGDALQAPDLEAAVSPELQPATRAKSGSVYVAGLDLGLRRDSSALVIVAKRVGEVRLFRERSKEPVHPTLAAMADVGHWRRGGRMREVTKVIKPTGRLRLAKVAVWRPELSNGGKVDLTQIERAVLHAHQRFNLARVSIDPYQAEHLAQRLERAGVPVALTSFTPANLQGMATALLEAFGDRQIDLFPHEQLLADLRALRVTERQYGFRLESPRGPSGHGDTATALSLALLAARDFNEPLGDVLIDGPLAY